MSLKQIQIAKKAWREQERDGSNSIINGFVFAQKNKFKFAISQSGVMSPDDDDWKKLLRMLKHLESTVQKRRFDDKTLS